MYLTLASAPFRYAWRKDNAWWFKRRVPASCKQALGTSQWAYRLGPINDENGCRIKAAEYERKTNELISTITNEVPPSPAEVELLFDCPWIIDEACTD